MRSRGTNRRWRASKSPRDRGPTDGRAPGGRRGHADHARGHDPPKHPLRGEPARVCRRALGSARGRRLPGPVLALSRWCRAAGGDPRPAARQPSGQPRFRACLDVVSPLGRPRDRRPRPGAAAPQSHGGPAATAAAGSLRRSRGDRVVFAAHGGASRRHRRRGGVPRVYAGTIERRYGLVVAILISGTMFAVAHLDFTLILWPYYVAVAAIYGTVTYLTESILPAVVLHTSGNLYSNLDLWLHGQAEWQAPSGPATLIWQTGADRSFWISSLAFLIVTVGTVWAYFRLAHATRKSPA